MTEHRPPWPADKKPQDRGVFQQYEKFATEAAVRLAFLDKYGYPPKYVKQFGGGWLAGPIWQWARGHDASEEEGR